MMLLLRRMRKRQGPMFALIAAFLFGASTPAAKWLLMDISPWLLAGLLYIGSGGGLLCVWLVRRRWWPQSVGEPLRRGDWPWVAASMAFGGVLAPLLLIAGLNHRDSASASLLLNTEAVLTAAIAWLMFGETFNSHLALSWVAILAGSCILGWSGVPDPRGLVAAMCILGACLCWAIDNNLSKRVADRDVLQFTTCKGLVAGATNTLLAITIGKATMTMELRYFALAGVACLVGFFGYGVGLLYFVLSLRHLGAARTAAYFSLAPFIGAGLALLLGQSQLNWQIMVASTLMATGLWLHVRADHPMIGGSNPR